ncbi:MAG: FtsK/SpoIIIE domain-containing protein [Defluviitaleaceae bacterium]|nr:FtsK/SpoIIIE domain-containing protein [Defluviitaleaceae bacterium]
MKETEILITAQFVDGGSTEKTEAHVPLMYTFDLLVQKDTKFFELLEAIELGISRTLVDIEKLQKPNEAGNPVVLHEDSRLSEHNTSKRIVDPKEDDSLSSYGVYKVCQKIFNDCVNAYNNITEPTLDESYCAGNRDENGVLLCHYKKGKGADSDASTEHESCQGAGKKCLKLYYNPIKKPAANRNCIGRGSVNFRVIKERELGDNPRILSYAHEDQIHIMKAPHDRWSLEELGFVTSTRLIFDSTGKHRSDALFDDTKINIAFRKESPLYNISEQPLKVLEDEPIRIIPPSDPPKKNVQNAITALLSPLLASGTMIGARLIIGGGFMGNMMIIMSISMALVGVVMFIINRIERRKAHKKAVSDWRTHYETYVKKIVKEIRERRGWCIRKLNALHPDRSVLIKRATELHGDIFSRGQSHQDFLTIRIGDTMKGSQLTQSAFKIIGEKKDVVFTTAEYRSLSTSNGYAFNIFLPEEKENAPPIDTNIDYKIYKGGYLIDLPSHIASDYEYLDYAYEQDAFPNRDFSSTFDGTPRFAYAPVLLRLKDCGTLGITSTRGSSAFRPLLDKIIFDLCYYHSPDDVQCVMFCKETSNWREQEYVIDRYKHLPHFRELLGDLSAFSFNATDANLVLNRLMEVLTERNNLGEDVKQPHIVMFFLDEDVFFKRHPVSRYLPDSPENHSKDITFIFCKQYADHLPKYCGQIIEINNSLPWRLLPHTQTIRRSADNTDKSEKIERHFSFVPDIPEKLLDRIKDKEQEDVSYRAFKMLSALYYYRIAQGANVPPRVELRELYDIELQKEKSAFWGSDSKDVTKGLGVPIGKKAGKEKNDVILDLHEDKDGPHMLVAGTTGSGKTETILTYLIGLCTYYSPEQVNLLLVDMKGGGFIQRLSNLPHIVGRVTDIDGDEGGAGNVYMLKRFLKSMNHEATRRKKLLSRMEVDSVDKYIELQSDAAKLDEHINVTLKLKKGTHQARIDDLLELKKRENALSHLFVVVDEFTELMKITNEHNDIDFKGAIDSLVRIGRSLGFHIILVSQNIEGAITEEIRVNVKAKLCLKVATREASRVMIGNDDAYGPLMPGNGRAHLLVGAGTRYEYFQSGYSGASSLNSDVRRIIVKHAEKTGAYTLFYDSFVHNAEAKESDKKARAADTQLKRVVDGLSKFAEDHDREAPRIVLRPLLNAHCYYKFESDAMGEAGPTVVDIEVKKA